MLVEQIRSTLVIVDGAQSKKKLSIEVANVAQIGTALLAMLINMDQNYQVKEGMVGALE